MELNTIYNECCLTGMQRIADKSVDMILCDLPYGTTQNQWDAVIPFAPLWQQYERVIKDNGAIVLTSAQPFTTTLISSNISLFRYSLVWDKVGTTGFQTAAIMPLRRHEDISVFYKKKPVYNPAKKAKGNARKKGGSKVDNGCYGDLRSKESFNNSYYPTSIIQKSNASKKGLIHPTQKPVSLFSYLIAMYTNECEIVLDNCMGSGTTAIACLNSNRNFIGFEMDQEYHRLATERIQKHKLHQYQNPTFNF